MTNGDGKSDSSVVPEKPPNKAGRPAAEAVEGRELAKGNPVESNTPRTQRRDGVPSALERIRQAARRDRKQRFTALLHHVYDVERLRAAYLATKRDAAAGVDGETRRHYGENLEANLLDLSGRLKRGAYRAKPVRRAYIPKADGRLRPLGVPTLEDKIVQRAVVEVMNAIYEEDFLGFSYGFRPGRSPRQALDALSAGIMTKKVNWVLDADIRDFVGTLVHEWLVKFVEHRIGDRRVVRLIQNGWLPACWRTASERAARWERFKAAASRRSWPTSTCITCSTCGPSDGERSTRAARSSSCVLRTTSSLGFQHRAEAERFLAELRERFAQFGLDLHPDKTRHIEFGRFADENSRGRGDGKAASFNFLGFTHSCAKTRMGRFTVLRQTMRSRWQAKLRELRGELKRRLHHAVPDVGVYLGSVVRGHIRYYGVPMNAPALGAFRRAVIFLWRWVLERRSQTGRVTWKRMQGYARRWLPPVRICHPYPLHRFAVTTQGKSRVR